jgi:hypothetical protein
MAEASTIYVDTRDGPAPARIPADIAAAIAAAPGERAEHAMEVAGLVLVRLGSEAGATLLRHLLAHAPEVLAEADPLFVETLASQPELIVGPLAGTAPCNPT